MICRLINRLGFTQTYTEQMQTYLTPIPFAEEDVCSFLIRREMDLAYSALIYWWSIQKHVSNDLNLTIDAGDNQFARITFSVTLSAAREQVYEFLRLRNIHEDILDNPSPDILNTLSEQLCHYVTLLRFVCSSNIQCEPRFPRVQEYFGVQFTFHYETEMREDDIDY